MSDIDDIVRRAIEYANAILRDREDGRMPEWIVSLYLRTAARWRTESEWSFMRAIHAVNLLRSR